MLIWLQQRKLKSKMADEEIEQVMSDVSKWSVEDLRELSDQIINLVDCIESDENRIAQ